MRNIAELNINEGGKPVVRQAPTIEVVREFEQFFQLSLPTAFVEFLSQANGGHPERNSIVPKGGESSNRFGVDCFYHLTDDNRTEPMNLWRVTKEWREILGPSCIPIGRDGGGNQFFIDLERHNAILVCIHDESFKRVLVADSLIEFLDLLEEDPDMI